jgi:hypothetical protein
MLSINARIVLIISVVFCSQQGCSQPAQRPPENVETPTMSTVVSAYERGQEEGRAAALQQFGINTPQPPRAYKYVSNTDTPAQAENNPEEESRGYVDGYHRALDTIYCPANSMSR